MDQLRARVERVLVYVCVFTSLLVSCVSDVMFIFSAKGLWEASKGPRLLLCSIVSFCLCLSREWGCTCKSVYTVQSLPVRLGGLSLTAVWLASVVKGNSTECP